MPVNPGRRLPYSPGYPDIQRTFLLPEEVLLVVEVVSDTSRGWCGARRNQVVARGTRTVTCGECVI